MKTKLLATAFLLIGCGAPSGSATSTHPVGGKADETKSGCATDVTLADGSTLTVHVCEFGQVAPGIYRGARPSADVLKELDQLGVKIDLDLEDDSQAVADENNWLQGTSLTMVSEPMSALWSPDDQQVNRILALLADPTQPKYIHCRLGEDRTGLLIGLYRVLYQSWDPQAAADEMLSFRFHKLYFNLWQYFEYRTGYTG